MSPEDISYYRRWLHDELLSTTDTQVDFAPQTTYPLCDFLCYIRDWLWQPCCRAQTYNFVVHVVDSTGIYSEVPCSINLICP